MRILNHLVLLGMVTLAGSAFADKKVKKEKKEKKEVVETTETKKTEETTSEEKKPAHTNGYESHYGMAGCGLGSIVGKEMKWGNNSAQILAATTNGTAYSQTFGMTFGTSNCVDSKTMALKNEQEVFINVNIVDLRNDASKGDGEYLNAMADLFGCSEDHSSLADFKSLSKSSHQNIFENSDAAQVRVQYLNQIKGNMQLAKNCVRAS